MISDKTRWYFEEQMHIKKDSSVAPSLPLFFFNLSTLFFSLAPPWCIFYLISQDSATLYNDVQFTLNVLTTQLNSNDKHDALMNVYSSVQECAMI